MKRCRHCKEPFEPVNSLQVACCMSCAIAVGSKEARLKRKRDTRAKLQLVKSRQDWIREAQTAFNAYIRARDEAMPCISCGLAAQEQRHGGQFDCGHYRSTGSAAHLRFNTLNAAKQCVRCNRYLSSNTVEYRKALVNKLGADRVDRLESDNTPRKFTVEYLRRVKAVFSRRARHIKRLRDGTQNK